MVAGHHGLDELPDEITTPGHGQIRAMIINCGNPVVSGPNGDKLDAALAQLDLLVVIDLVQRESHRHAHWLLPAAHWLERDDLPAFTCSMHDEPYVQYGRKAVEPPPGAREEWRDLRRPRARDAQAALRLSRGQRLHQGHATCGSPTQPAGARVHAALDRPAAACAEVNGRKVKWRDIMAHPHGLVFGRREFGHFKKALRTEDKMIHAAPPEFLARTRELLAAPARRSACRLPVPAGQPPQPALDELLAQRAARRCTGRASGTRW